MVSACNLSITLASYFYLRFHLWRPFASYSYLYYYLLLKLEKFRCTIIIYNKITHAFFIKVNINFIL